MSLPTSHERLRQKKFSNWLLARGAEILPPADNELMRWRAGESIFTISMNGSGKLIWSNGADSIYACYRAGKYWTATKKTRRRKRLDAEVHALRERDGDICFYCGKPITAGEETIEHIVSLIHSGPDNLANKALSHGECNKAAGNSAVVEKVKLRDQMLRRTRLSSEHQ